MMNIVFKG